jgi:hypothetical protein
MYTKGSHVTIPLTLFQTPTCLTCQLSRFTTLQRSAICDVARNLLCLQTTGITYTDDQVTMIFQFMLHKYHIKQDRLPVSNPLISFYPGYARHQYSNIVAIHLDCRKYFFSNKVVNVWNKLPNNSIPSNAIGNFKRN